MLQGGDKLAAAKAELEEEKAKLFSGSPQGKRKINQLAADLEEAEKELDGLSNQEKEFSDLQRRQEEMKSRLLPSSSSWTGTTKKTTAWKKAGRMEILPAGSKRETPAGPVFPGHHVPFQR